MLLVARLSQLGARGCPQVSSHRSDGVLLVARLSQLGVRLIVIIPMQ